MHSNLSQNPEPNANIHAQGFFQGLSWVCWFMRLLSATLCVKTVRAEIIQEVTCRETSTGLIGLCFDMICSPPFGLQLGLNDNKTGVVEPAPGGLPFCRFQFQACLLFSSNSEQLDQVCLIRVAAKLCRMVQQLSMSKVGYSRSRRCHIYELVSEILSLK